MQAVPFAAGLVIDIATTMSMLVLRFHELQAATVLTCYTHKMPLAVTTAWPKSGLGEWLLVKYWRSREAAHPALLGCWWVWHSASSIQSRRVLCGKHSRPDGPFHTVVAAAEGGQGVVQLAQDFSLLGRGTAPLTPSAQRQTLLGSPRRPPSRGPRNVVASTLASWSRWGAALVDDG